MPPPDGPMRPRSSKLERFLKVFLRGFFRKFFRVTVEEEVRLPVPPDPTETSY